MFLAYVSHTHTTVNVLYKVSNETNNEKLHCNINKYSMYAIRLLLAEEMCAAIHGCQLPRYNARTSLQTELRRFFQNHRIP